MGSPHNSYWSSCISIFSKRPPYRNPSLPLKNPSFLVEVLPTHFEGLPSTGENRVSFSSSWEDPCVSLGPSSWEDLLHDIWESITPCWEKLPSRNPFIRVSFLLFKFHTFYSSSVPFIQVLYLLFELCTFYSSFVPFIRVVYLFSSFIPS